VNCIAGGASSRRTDPAPTADSPTSPRQQTSVASLVSEVKSDIRREMDQLSRRIDQIDKQVSTILQMLTVISDQTPPASTQRYGGTATDSSSTDKKALRAVQSPSFMDTIAEQEENTSSLLKVTEDVGKE